MKKVTRTLMNLRKMSELELEGIMVELRNQIEEQCEWGSDSLEESRFEMEIDDARDLSLDRKYLETKADLIKYIRKADTILMRKKTMEAFYNFSF